MTADVDVRYDEARGCWYAQPYLGRSADGRQIRPRRSFPDAATEAEARELAAAWVRGLTEDGRVRSAVIADMLADYIADRAAKDAAANTVKRWRLFARYVARYLKGRTARELTAKDMNDFEGRLLAPKSRGGQGLCPNTVIGVHNFLRGAYRYWLRIGLVDANPMLSTHRLRPQRHEAVALDELDFARLDGAISARMRPDATDDRHMRKAAYAFAAWMALHTGMRLAEVCALRRRDLNRRFLYVHVCGQVVEPPGGGVLYVDATKGRRSRNVSMTAQEFADIDAFLRLQDRVYGPQRRDAPLVSAGGGYMRPGTVSLAFSRLRDECGLPRGCTFHSLRHTHATWCLASGVTLKTLSERLGHADEAITLRVYAHLAPGQDQAAAKAFEDFAAGLRGSANGV